MPEPWLWSGMRTLYWNQCRLWSAKGARPAIRDFSHGGWIDAELKKIHIAFSDADQALENLQKRLDQEADIVCHRRLQKFVSDLCLRFSIK